MSFECSLWCYLWDLEDEGFDRALDVIQGDLGANGISVATVYHSVDQLRPHDGVSPRWFRSAGGMQFQPDAARYRGTRTRPVVADWLRSRNPLAGLSAACEKRGLALRGWTVCCHSSAMVARNPSLAVKDVFGSPSPSWLCPLNPDVQEFLRAVVEDLTHSYRFDSIELEACGFPRSPHGHAHEKVGVNLGAIGRMLLALCFCESCRQQASLNDVPVAAVERSVAVDLEGIFRNSGDRHETDIEPYLDSREPLRRFLEWRAAGVAGLIGRLRTACSGSLVLMLSEDPLLTSSRRNMLAGTCDRFLTPAYGADEAAVEERLRQAAADTGSPARVVVGLNACAGFTNDAASLVRNVGRIATLGAAGVHFYNYGLLPQSRLEWVRQAIRYGRRQNTADAS